MTVDEREVDVFLEFSCFLYDPTDVSNLVSGFSAFSKPNLYIWKFLVHVLLKAKVRIRHGTMDWFQTGKGVCQGCILSPCLFNFYAEYIMQNAGLDESQAGLQIARGNINNLRYGDNIILMAESEEELKSLLMRVKEKSEKSWLES